MQVVLFTTEILRDSLHKLSYFKDSGVDGLNGTQLSDREYPIISSAHQRRYGTPYEVTLWDRVVALRQEAVLMAAYEKEHVIRTRADRDVESSYVADRVLERMQCQIRRDPLLADQQPCSPLVW